MARVIRSPQAKRDIVGILAYTKRRWGSAQAHTYGELMREALVAIADDPTCGSLREDIRPGILGHHVGQHGRARHIIFYRIGPTGLVEIVRVLHDAMDFERHVP